MTARDSKALSVFNKPIKTAMATCRDLEKKMTELAFSLLIITVEEEKRLKKVQGIAMITLMAGDKKVINNVRGIKYVYVLFHSGEQLFLTLEGKGKKGMRVEAEWLLHVERVWALMVESQKSGPLGSTGHGSMILAARGLVSLSTLAACVPLQCVLEGKSR